MWVLQPKSHPETRQVFSDCILGSGISASSTILFICYIRHHVYSVYSSTPKFHSPMCFMFPNFALFHVSVLLHIFTPLFYFHSPNPDPDICLILVTLTCSSSILIHSKPHVYSSVWNRHWLSLELLVRTSEPLSAPRPKFKDSRHLAVQHISWSQVLTKNIVSQYTLGPCPSS